MGMNKLPLSKRVAILNGLCEGLSMRALARLQDVSFNTVAKALVDAGPICAQMHDELVRDVKSRRVQCKEPVFERLKLAMKFHRHAATMLKDGEGRNQHCVIGH